MTVSNLLRESIDGCRRKDRKSQRIIYEMYYSKMMPICLRYSKNADDAKDILHESFIKVFTSIDKNTDGGSFEGWVRRIVTNTSIDAYRKKSNSKEYSGQEYIENIEEEEEVETNWFIENQIPPERVIEEVQKLSPAYRTAFNLYVIEGYTHQEIADYLNITTGSSKSNLAKAKMKLRKVLNELIEKKNELG